MSNLLIDDRPIMFLPRLAIALDSCERAIILQQIHWLAIQPHNGRVVDGHKWVWGSYEDWCRDYFPMWKPQNLAKHIRKLEEMGVLISAELNAKEHDHTKHYRIDYDHERLHSIIYSGIVSERDGDIASIPNRNTPSINSTKTPTKNTPQKKSAPPSRAQKAPEEKRNYHPDEYSDIIL